MSGIMQGTKQMLSQWQGVVLLGNRGWGLFHPPLPLEVSLWTQGLVCAILAGLVRCCPYRHNDWGEEGPAEFPPDAGPEANHLLDVVIESVDTYDIWSKSRTDG